MVTATKTGTVSEIRETIMQPLDLIYAIDPNIVVRVKIEVEVIEQRGD